MGPQSVSTDGDPFDTAQQEEKMNSGKYSEVVFPDAVVVIKYKP
jgi:hypothetical protein